MPGYDLWWVDDDIRELPFDRAVVQLIHHSAHSSLACGHDAASTPFCDRNTWQWGNVEIQPSVPFTLLHGDRAYVDATTTDTVNFDAPAPADAQLRFLAFGTQTQISFDGGASWQLAQTKRQWPRQGFAAVWRPIPEGVTSVRVRAYPWMMSRQWVPWLGRDFSIVAPPRVN